MNITEVCIRKPVLAWMIMLGLIIFGGLCFKKMGVGQMPDVDFPMANINVIYEGAAPEIMEMDIIDPIEGAVMSVEGVKSISSSARRGSANVSVEFDLNKDIDVAIQEIQTKLSQTMGQLPSDVEAPIVSKMNPEDQPIMWLSVSSETLTRRDLMKYVKDKIKDQFLSVTGVSDVILGGHIEPNLRVWADNKKLNQLDLSVLDILNAISSEHAELPAGTFSEGNKELNVRTLGESKNVDEFRHLSISRRGGSTNYSPIQLKDVAEIEDGLDDIRRISRVNGKPSVGLGIRKIRGANAVAVSDAVKEKMERIKKNLPQGSEIGVNYDSTNFIRDSIHELNLTLVISAALTAFVCWLFLGSLGTTLNVVLSIPTSIIGTFFTMYIMGFTLNTFTLLALTLAVGLVVDDNIMILENIVRHGQMGKKRMIAALEGTKEISFAALSASIAIVAIFLPIGFMDGIIGKYFYQFALTMTFTIIFSYIDAITFTPMRAAHMVGQDSKELTGPQWVENLVHASARLYQRSLHFCIEWKWAVVLSSILFFVGTLYSSKLLRKEFAPPQDQGILLLRLTTPPGSSLAFTDQKTKELESILSQRPELLRYFVTVGGFGGNEATSSIVFMTLKPKEQRPRDIELKKVLTQQELADLLRPKFKDIKGAQIFVRDLSQGGFGGGHGRGFPVEFGLQGGDWKKLQEYSNVLKEEMTKNGSFVDVDSNFKGDIPEVHILPNREKALLHGVSIQDLGKVIRATVNGIVAGKFSQDGRRYDIRVKLKEGQVKDLEDIKNIKVRNNRGELISIDQVATIEITKGLQTIYRENRLRSLSMYANLKDKVSLSKALDLAKTLAQKILPTDYTFVESGSAKSFKESSQGLLFVLAMGLIISYMILGAQFNSFIAPFIIMVPLPFSLSGALLSLLLFNQSLNVYSMIGIILLMGIVKKNSIILVDYTNQLRQEEGLSVKEALIKACPIRLRPILMTSLATIVGALPSVFMRGPGFETRVPMGLTIAGGSLISTLLTLFVVPALYAILIREKKKNEVKIQKAATSGLINQQFPL